MLLSGLEFCRILAEVERTYSDTAFPRQVVVEATAACNQACIFCGRTYMERPKRTMTRQVWNRIVEEIGRESPYTELWPAFMGEPLLLGRVLFSMIGYAREVGCRKITLNTNGTRLNGQTIPGILNCGIDRLIVSCDAHTPETHAKVRPPLKPGITGGLESIYAGVNELIERIKDGNLKRPIIEMQFSIFQENEHEFEAFREYWLAKGVVVKCRPKLYWSGLVAGSVDRTTLDPKVRVPCLWALDTMGIHWNGSIVMCAVDCDGQYVAGNVEMQSMKEVWNGPLRWTRELQRQSRFSELPEICRRCPDWNVKKAHVYFPNDAVKQDYEEYIREGRTFLPAHYWQEAFQPIR